MQPQRGDSGNRRLTRAIGTENRPVLSRTDRPGDISQDLYSVNTSADIDELEYWLGFIPMHDSTLPFRFIGTVFGPLAVALLVLANAFFVAFEFGLVAVDRSRIDDEAQAGSKQAARVQRLLGNLSFQLSGAQLGITASSLILGFIARPALATIIDPVLDGFVGESAVSALSVVLAIGLATVFQMVVGELVPKTIAIERSFEVATRLAAAGVVWGVVAKPIISSFDGAANWAVRRLGIEPVEELEHLRSLDEIERLVDSSGAVGTLDIEDVNLIKRSIRLGEKTAADALIPRTEVVWLSATATGRHLAETAIESGHSRFPVYGHDADDVVGVVHVKALHAVERGQRDRTPISELMAEPSVVPETIDLDDLLTELRETRAHLSVVVDEHGGTAGIITVEDILEEIVGEIQDEYDGASPTLTRTEERGTTLLAGSLHHDEIFDACGFVMPDGEYETLAGFVLDRLGRIPSPGDRFDHDGWRVEVVAMDRRRIASVRLIAPRPDPSIDEAATV